MKRTTWTWGILLCLTSACASSGAAETASREARVDALFAEWDRPDSPGGVFGVIENGELVHVKSFGSANLEHGVPNGPDVVFDLGSTSKQFTATCVLLLAQEQKLSLDDDVRRHVPELHDYGHVVTLRQMLQHTSGLRDYLVLYALSGVGTEDYTTQAGALDLVSRQFQLDFVPGTEWSYSNTGYFLASLIVERASGKTLAEFARERVFEPLGMHDTHVHDDHRVVVRGRAQGYSRRPDGGFGIDMSDFEQTGDGAVFTTLRDLVRWDENFYTGRVGSTSLVETLQTRGKLDDGRELAYGLGLFLGKHRGLPVVSHGGAWAGFRAELMRYPSEHTSFVCLANLSDIDPTDLCRRAAEIWLAEKLGPEPAPRVDAAAADPADTAPRSEPYEPPLADVVALRGTYRSEELAVEWVVSGAGRELSVGVPGRVGVPLAPRAKDRWDCGGATIAVLRREDGAISGLSVDAGRVRRLTFLRTDAH